MSRRSFPTKADRALDSALEKALERRDFYGVERLFFYYGCYLLLLESSDAVYS